ncbi:MAG: hypothetical protein EXS36_15225 [Pedosphaera sp.]|nr:hypothetical protein [Pedosphaera sp.]
MHSLLPHPTKVVQQNLQQLRNAPLWFSGRHHALQFNFLTRYFGTNFLNFTYASTNLSYFLDITAAPDGGLWVAHDWSDTESFGVSRFDGKQFERLTTTNGLPGNKVRSIYCEPNGVAWFLLPNTGVCRYDPRGRKFETFTSARGRLAHNSVRQMTRASCGSRP